MCDEKLLDVVTDYTIQFVSEDNELLMDGVPSSRSNQPFRVKSTDNPPFTCESIRKDIFNKYISNFKMENLSVKSRKNDSVLLEAKVYNNAQMLDLTDELLFQKLACSLYWEDSNHVIEMIRDYEVSLLQRMFLAIETDYEIPMKKLRSKLITDDGYIYGDFITQMFFGKFTSHLEIALHSDIFFRKELIKRNYTSVKTQRHFYDQMIDYYKFSKDDLTIGVSIIPENIPEERVSQEKGLTILDCRLKGNKLIFPKDLDQLKIKMIDDFPINTNDYLLESFISSVSKYEGLSFVITKNFMDTMVGAIRQNLDILFRWNLKIEKEYVSSLPQFRLTIREGDAFEAQNVLLVFGGFMPNFNIFQWRIHWEDLRQDKKESAIQLYPGSKNNFVILNGEMIFIENILSKIFTSEISETRKFAGSNLPETCFNAAMVHDENLSEFLKEDEKSNIVFLLAKKDGTFISACTTKEILKNYSIYFYQCAKQNGYDNKSLFSDQKYVRIAPFPEPFIITDANLHEILQSSSRFFLVEETPFVLQYTISVEAYNGMNDANGSFVSADHCQPGSDKKLMIVHILESDNLLESLENINKRQRT